DAFPHARRVLERPDSVPDAIRVQCLDRPPDRRGPEDLAGMRNRAQATLAREAKGGGEVVGGRGVLDTSEPDANDAALAAVDRHLHDARGLLRRRRAVEVGREADLDAELLARLLDAVAVALEHHLERHTVPGGH